MIQAHVPSAPASGRKLMLGGHLQSADVPKGGETVVREDEAVEPYLGYLPRQSTLRLGSQVRFIHVVMYLGTACRFILRWFKLAPYSD